ncbi:MAG TPA: hypothetical protein VNQ79_03815 [Blastocatellia bacterium]|nr:hypothetical protein [Blastocatellia bacterium]
MTFKGTMAFSQRSLVQKAMALHRAGRTEDEIAESLGIASSTVRYIATLFLTGSDGGERDQRPRVAYELRLSGHSFTEIGQMLNISRPRAHQIVHKYEWSLRRHRQRSCADH